MKSCVNCIYGQETGNPACESCIGSNYCSKQEIGSNYCSKTEDKKYLYDHVISILDDVIIASRRSENYSVPDYLLQQAIQEIKAIRDEEV